MSISYNPARPTPPLRLKIVADEQDLLSVQTLGAIIRDALFFNQSPEQMLKPESFSMSVLLDLSNCTNIDSAGVSWLIRLHRRCEDGGGRLIIHSLHRNVERTIRPLNMDLFLTIAEDEASARALAAD